MYVIRKRRILLLLGVYKRLTRKSLAKLLTRPIETTGEALHILECEGKIGHETLPRRKGQVGKCAYNYFLLDKDPDFWESPHVVQNKEIFKIAGIEFQFSRRQGRNSKARVRIINFYYLEIKMIAETVHEKYRKCAYSEETIKCQHIDADAQILASLLDELPMCCNHYDKLRKKNVIW